MKRLQFLRTGVKTMQILRGGGELYPPVVQRASGLSAAPLACLPWLALLASLAEVSWFLCDDAFISFRYARNLLEGHGLVFNPGERVEGYSNFLWVLELAALWGLFGLRPEHVAPWLSVACTAGTLAALWWWAARSPALAQRGLVGWMALGLVCSSATFAVWTSGGGLETRQFTFCIVLAVVSLSLYRDNRWGLLASSLSLALAALTRPEGPLIAACCFGWFAVERMVKDRRLRLDWREVLYLVGPFATLVAAHFLFRYTYYGEWLPNTYYAKHVRPWYESGFRYLWAAALETGLYLLLPLAAVAAHERWRAHRDGAFALPLLLMGVHMAYVMRIGGDHFEYRPLDFYWPLLALPAAAGIVHLGSRLAAGRRRPRLPGLVGMGARAWAVAVFVPVLFYAGAIQGAKLFEGAAIREYILGLYIELDDENAGWLLHAPGMPMLVAISNDLRRLAARQSVALPFTEHREFAKSRFRGYKRYEKMERGIIPDDALAVYGGGLGIRSYYLPALKVIDILGLTDATVARNPVTHANHERFIAHDRRPLPGYLEERGVNIIVRAADRNLTQALMRGRYAVQVGPDLWMSFDSPDEEWVLARFAGRGLHMRGIQYADLSWEKAVPDFNYRSGDLGFSWMRVWDPWVQVFARNCTPGELLVWPWPRSNGKLDALTLHRWTINEAGLCRTAVTRYSGWIRPLADDPSRLEEAKRTKAALRSVFDVHLLGKRLIYFKQPCRRDDKDAQFFLHVVPADERDLPSGRREYGFDNLDFRMEEPTKAEGRCAAVRRLPDYPIAEIRTGQFTDEGRLWEGTITVAGRGSDERSAP